MALARAYSGLMQLRAALCAVAALFSATLCFAEMPKLYSVPLKNIDGAETTLQPLAGKVLLIVNVASECGYTPQYEGLEALHKKYQGQGFAVLGFPSNDFGQQEPGTEAAIKEFCASRFNVTFPMYSKIHVSGAQQHPLYAALTGPASAKPGPVTWNFGKFLIGRDGQVAARFEADVEPESNELTQAIERALAAK
jgi:glutathione peroxidase